MSCYAGVVRFWGRPPELLQPFVLEAAWPLEREPDWWLEPKELRKAGAPAAKALTRRGPG